MSHIRSNFGIEREFNRYHERLLKKQKSLQNESCMLNLEDKNADLVFNPQSNK